MKKIKISSLKSLIFGVNLYLFSASSESNWSSSFALSETIESKSEYPKINKNEEPSSQIYVLRIGGLLSFAIFLYGSFLFFQNHEEKPNNEIVI